MSEKRETNPIGTAFGLARLGVDAYARGLRWGAEQYVKAGTRVVRAATQGESLGQLAEEAGHQLREYAREALGVNDVERKVEDAMPATVAVTHVHSSNGDGPDGPDVRRQLRARGAELLARSADVHAEEPFHPAYARILDELAPDEARVLRFLAAEGPQPAIDVRTARPLDIGSQLVAPGLQMIGTQAGCRFLERVPAYLNNLHRLGLIWFSREALADPLRYQVLEAQPDVIAALKQAGRGKTVRRQIALTPFGQDFCAVCLPPATVGPGSRRPPAAPTAIPPPSADR